MSSEGSSSFRSYINPERMSSLGLHHLEGGDSSAVSRPAEREPNRHGGFRDQHDHHGGSGGGGGNRRRRGPGGHGGGHGGGGGGGSSAAHREGVVGNVEPTAKRRDFGYDDSKRPPGVPQPTLWDVLPTTEDLIRQQEYFLQSIGSTSFGGGVSNADGPRGGGRGGSSAGAGGYGADDAGIDLNALMGGGSADTALQQLLANQGLPVGQQQQQQPLQQQGQGQFGGFGGYSGEQSSYGQSHGQGQGGHSSSYGGNPNRPGGINFRRVYVGNVSNVCRYLRRNVSHLNIF